MKKIKKVWGEEYWLVNKSYCGKILRLKKDCRCSLHYHKSKHETFLINKGKVLMEVNNTKKIMEPGEFIEIKPRTKHRFTGLEDSEIIEFSTHHNDKDSYREIPSGKVNEN